MMKNDRFKVEYHPKFKKELGKLKKKCPSIKDDLKRLIRSIKKDLIYHGSLPNNNYKQIFGLGSVVTLPVFKIKKFRCEKIPKGNRSGFRIIFIYHVDLYI